MQAISTESCVAPNSPKPGMKKSSLRREGDSWFNIEILDAAEPQSWEIGWPFLNSIAGNTLRILY
jgi:hypothetical protein